MKTRKPKILIVDDEEWNLRVLASYLLPQGYEVITANDAEEVLRRVDEDKLDLILLDVMMPGKDGFTLCREIKKQKRLQSIPIILITARHETIDKVNGLESGADDVLTKPVEREELSARVRAHLRIKFLVDEIDAWNKNVEQKIRDRTKELSEENKDLDESYFLGG